MQNAEYYQQKISQITFPNQAFIGGKYAPAISGKTFSCISPVNGKTLVEIAECDQKDVDHAVKNARNAFNAGYWANMPAKKRKKILLNFAEIIHDNQEELALLETLDVGKPINRAAGGDIPGVIDCVRWYAEACDKIYDELAPQQKNAISMITREPIGVVAAVVPWNYPLLMAAWKFAPALAAGNAIIVKPAEQSPLTVLRIAEFAAQAGIPEGIFQVIPGFGETAGQALGRHTDVDMIAFTGSGEVGKLFLKYAGESNMKAVSLECGGKSPNIVFSDAQNLDIVAKEAAGGVFENCGQVCTAATRLIVHKNIKDQIIDKITQEAQKWQPGDPLNPETQVGAIVDTNQMKRVMNYIDVGKKEGAKIETGGNPARQETGGTYVQPTVFNNVNNTMRIAQEEIFGPVLSVIEFNDDQEAVKIANDTIYGLQAYLWTSDINKAHKTARQIRAGTVIVNSNSGGDITVPFGGYKQSGIGRDKSLHAIDKYTQLKHTRIQIR